MSSPVWVTRKSMSDVLRRASSICDAACSISTLGCVWPAMLPTSALIAVSVTRDRPEPAELVIDNTSGGCAARTVGNGARVVFGGRGRVFLPRGAAFCLEDAGRVERVSKTVADVV